MAQADRSTAQQLCARMLRGAIAKQAAAQAGPLEAVVALALAKRSESAGFCCDCAGLEACRRAGLGVSGQAAAPRRPRKRRRIRHVARTEAPPNPH